MAFNPYDNISSAPDDGVRALPEPHETPDPKQVTPFVTYPTDELNESLWLEFVLRAEAAAVAAEASADRAETEADRAEQEADRATTEADRAEAEADKAEAAADRAESYFKEYPVGTADILNDITTPAQIIATSGDQLELDGAIAQSYILNFEVKRSVDFDYRFNTITCIAQFVLGQWYLQQIAQEIIIGADVDVSFEMQTASGRVYYTSSDMTLVSGNYQGTVDYKATRFA